MSSIQVSVAWVEPAVFAGEEVKCVITFQNAAQVASSRPVATHTRVHEHSHETRDISNDAHFQRQGLNHHDSDGTGLKGHQTPSPLTSPRTAKSLATKPGECKNGRNHLQPERGIPRRRHQRSISIVSVGSDAGTPKRPPLEVLTSARPARGHGRAISLQILPERVAVSNQDSSFGDELAEPSIQMQGCNPAITHDRVPNVPLNSRSSSIPTALASNPASDYNIQQGISGADLRSSQPRSRALSSSIWKSPKAAEASSSNNESSKSPTLTQFPTQGHSNRVPNSQDHPAGISTITINEATSRSSTDLYSRSNDSLDTLVSEYAHQDHNRFPQYSVHTRQRPFFASSKLPETLMMGYANVIGYFHLDTSLINASPFDEVKSKGVVGSQGGGGVVRPGAAKHRSGLLGSLGWNTLGDSLGGLLGSSEVSSIKETMGSTAAKWIPIISTSQSLLFVDLRLEPGQKRSYSYSYRLPAGIPPSYRGKAIRVSYNIVIGVQTATLPTRRHTVRQLEFPFRVFPGVNSRGETIGHNLMSPHVMLNREPLILELDGVKPIDNAPTDLPLQARGHFSDEKLSNYLGQLLDTPRRDSSVGLLSPSATETKSPTAAPVDNIAAEEAITLAIQRSNAIKPSKMSTTRFEIARGGCPVAVIMLTRPAYRLGEVIPVIIDFHKSEIPCFFVYATLETSEHIEPSLALRSPGSIWRASRKIHATQYESTISATRVFFNLAIPSISTPEFITSGISLEWNLRFEFVTNRQVFDEQESSGASNNLLEDVAEDERGSIMAGVQALPCENFDVSLPLRVFGGTSPLDDNHGPHESSI
ncbi:MAG: hypothetical protein Q9202_001044 [Teloschistes flavicans]